MLGRTEQKIKYEKKLQTKVIDIPCLSGYYFYLNEKETTTKTRYIDNVIRFLKYYKNTTNLSTIKLVDLSDINLLTIQEYISAIQFTSDNKELGSDARALIYSSLNSFCGYLKITQIIPENPFNIKGAIKRPKVHDNEITYLEPEEYKLIKQNILNGVGTPTQIKRQKKWMYRDLLLFQIPIMTGVRVTALSQIRLEDIDFDKKQIKVIDKAKEKLLYLDDHTYNLILIWLENRQEILKGITNCQYLFISEQKGKMNITTIERIIEKYTYNIDKHITPHKLRSTCGTNMYRATKDIYMVAEVLGHSSPATSRKYTKINVEDRRKAADMMLAQMNQD